MDRSANPWEADIFAVATQPESQYYDDLDTAYHEALRYYDENVGARLHQGLNHGTNIRCNIRHAVDAAYPTPPIDWARQDDHVTFDHHEVATVALTFNAEDHHYLGSHYQEGGLEVWKIRRVMADGGRVPAGGVQSSWDDAKSAFVTYWEDHCETQREIASSIGLRQGRG